jgi:hypothetical protein
MVNFDTNFEHRNGGSKELEQASDDADAMDRDDAWQRQLDEWRRLTGIDGLISAVTEMERRWDEVEARVAVGADRTGEMSGRGLGELKEQDEVLGGGATGEVAIRLSTILARRKLSSVVARWCARVARGRATMAGSAQQRRIEQMSSRECRRWRKACMRRLARAWWAGTRRETVTVLVRRWECVVRERNKRRVVALAAMAASAQTAIVRRVWLELVGRFWVDSRGGGGGGCEMEVEVERQKSGEGDGDSVVYDWSCTQCGWGGRLVKAGHSTCSKCEWQCLSWCEAAARIEMADDEMVGRMVQQRPMGRRVAAGVRRRMGEEMRRLQGDLVEQQSCGWRQRVQQTRQRDKAGGAGGQHRAVRLPVPRAKLVERGSGSFQFLSTGSDPVDKVGRLPEELRMRWRVVAVLWAGRAALAQMKSRMRVKMEAMAAEVEVEAAEVEAAEVETTEVEAAGLEAAEVEAAGMETAEVEAAGKEAAEVEAAKVETAEVKAAEVDAAEVEAAEVEAAGLEVAEVEAAGMETAEVEVAATEVEAAWQRVVGVLEGRSRNFRGFRVAMKVQQLKAARELELEEYHMEWLEQYKGTEAAREAEQQFGEERELRRQEILAG